MNLERNDDGTLAIEASDDGLTFTAHLSKPCAYFLDLCAFPAFFPVPEQAVTEADPNGENPGAWALESGFVTSGPMTCTAWKHNESMTYEKNPNYWNAENVTLDSINFMLSADDTAIYNAYNDGSLQFIDTIPNDENLLCSIQRKQPAVRRKDSGAGSSYERSILSPDRPSVHC